MKRSAALVFALVVLSALPAAAQALPSTVSTPILKWQRGGCTSFCQTGWYASPAVADLNGDGQQDVVWGSYDLVSLNGSTGAVQWRAQNGNRVWPGVAIADLTGDGTLEVVVGRGSDQLVVYSSTGSVIWTRNPFGSGEIRTLAVADLENDGVLEIVVGRASGGDTKQMSVYEPDGSVRQGWPARRDGDPGNGWGMYNENVTVGDVDGDGYKEIIGATDTHYTTTLDRNGNQIAANPIYGANKVWSQVGIHVDQAADLRGFANCGTEHRPNFANCAPAIADVDGNGSFEIVIPGDVYNCAIGDDVDGDLYVEPWILNLDRTRWAGSGFDWTVIPTPPPNSGPLSEDFDVIENNVHNAVVADLDGDGRKEILWPSYDGKLHAVWLDKTEHGSWPFDVPGSGIRFASEPAVVDIDNDGHAEVIFTSWPQKAGNGTGQLHILDYLGNPLQTVTLPSSFPSGSWNGGLGAPTVANIDADADKEIVVGTAASGVVAYDLPNSANARVLWGTGRGSYRRTGVSSTGTDSPAIYVASTGAWFVKYASSPGGANLAFNYGPAGVAWTPLSGDFSGNGTSTPGLYSPSTGTFFLRFANSPGGAARAFSFGAANAGFVPLVGDWNGDGTDTIGLYAPSTGTFFLRDSNSPGGADVTFAYGPPGLVPIVGDWNGDGIDTIGVYNPASGSFFLKNSNASGPADLIFSYGAPNLSPVAGDWNGDGVDTIGVVVGSTGTWFLRNSNGPGGADLVFTYGSGGTTPVVGNWDGQ